MPGSHSLIGLHARRVSGRLRKTALSCQGIRRQAMTRLWTLLGPDMYPMSAVSSGLISGATHSAACESVT